MYDVLKGIRVIEVAEWLFVPAAAAVLADWGAEVIKIEHAQRGDPLRGMVSRYSETGAINTMFEVGNRGKRSVGIDLSTAEGRDLVYALVEEADVFITSFMADSRAALGIEANDILERNPRIVYARGSGYGQRGPQAHKGGYDFSSTWCRAGIAHRMTPPEGQPPRMPGSVGDLTGAATLAGAISAALVKRERTGRGVVVENSLYSVGIWLMCQAITAATFGVDVKHETHENPNNPLSNLYRTKDDRWISICLMQARWWPDFCRHIGREDLIDDPRYADQASRTTNRTALVRELDDIFATRTYNEWVKQLQTLEGVWDPVQTPSDVIHDEQALVNGFLTPVSMMDGTSFLGAPAPGQFDEQLPGALTASPEAGQHTEEVLLELGLDWERIGELKDLGVVT